MKEFWTKLRQHQHFHQLLIIAAVAAGGLLAGSVFAAATGTPLAIIASPSPQLQRIVVQVTPTALAVKVIPLGSPTPKAAVKATTGTKPKVAASSVAKAPAAKRSFLWGTTILAFPFREQNEEFLGEQFRLSKELGLSVVRIDYSVNNPAMNKRAIDLANQHGLKLVFIIPFGPNDIFSDGDLYNNAYKYVADIVGQHKGQVQVWQLATEVASVAIIDGGHYGVDRVDYPEKKFQAVSTWLKAASKAVKESDPSARRLINDQWVHVGFFDRFIAEGGDFDILGWNWFSDMGTDWTNPVINTATGQRYKLLAKLKSFKKDIWLTEVNRRGGSNDGKEMAQADYIQTMAEKAYAEPAIKSFLVFNLAEDQLAPSQERGYGIVKTSAETHAVVGVKEAFGRYKNLIKAK